MRLATQFRPFSDVDLIEGRITDQQRDQWAEQIREARLEVARSTRSWTEIPETRLVPRGRGLLVDAETDLIYTRRRGVVWEPGRASVGYVTDNTPLTFYVDQAGEVVFLDQPGGMPATWSEVVARKARRGATA